MKPSRQLLILWSRWEKCRQLTILTMLQYPPCWFIATLALRATGRLSSLLQKVVNRDDATTHGIGASKFVYIKNVLCRYVHVSQFGSCEAAQRRYIRNPTSGRPTSSAAMNMTPRSINIDWMHSAHKPIAVL